MEEVESLTFEFLPNTDDFWIVLYWGNLILDLEGNYRIQLVLNRLADAYTPQKVNLAFENTIINVDYGALRAMSAGTIVHKRKIVAFIQDYRTIEKKINIPANEVSKGTLVKHNPIFQIRPLDDFLQPAHISEFEKLKRKPGFFPISHFITNVPVVSFIENGVNYIIPCGAIADYYFFGKPKLIKYILTGQIDRSNRRKNKVYDPSKARISMYDDNKKALAYVRLEKDMFDEDAYKIARLAHDKPFWNECIKISHNLVAKTEDDSFIQCGFPFDTAETLTVYGRDVVTQDGTKGYFVYKIIKCSSKPPFNSLIRSRDNKGKKKGTGNSQEGSTASDSNNDGPGDGRPKNKILLVPTKPKENKPGAPTNPPSNEKLVGDKKALYGSIDEVVTFENAEQNNFPESMIVDEEDLVSDAKGKGGNNERLKFFKKEVGELTYTTEYEKNGNGNVIRIRLNSDSIAKPDVPPTTCFEMIEKALVFSEELLRNHSSISSLSFNIFCPYKYSGNLYSIFPLAEFSGFDPKMIKLRKFCFMEIKKDRQNVFRRLLAYEIRANGKFFYVLDIQARYRREKVFKSKPNEPGFSWHKAVIFHRNTGLTETEAKSLLVQIVERKGNWQQISSVGPKFRTLHHTKEDKMHYSIYSFIKTQLQID